MEAEATPPAKTLRKLKGFENAASSNFKHQNPFMKHFHIYQLIGRQNNHFSITKGLILLSIVVVLFLNIIGYLFSYRFLSHPILIISSFSSSKSASYDSSFYRHDLSSSNISSSNPPTFLNSSTTLSSRPPPPPPIAVNFNSLPPPSPLEVNLSPPSSNFGNSINRELIKDCDLSKGEWVRDWKAPYYTNTTCYTIQEHQNCMKYGKPNLDFLKWRWKPDGCELPLFEPKQFLEIMRGKTLAFVGDSLARNQMQSLMCLLSRVMYPKDISKNSDDNFKRMYYPAFNFTITIFWSPFLIKAKETKGPKNTYLWKLYLDQVDNKWASHIDEFDYLILSAGHQ
ncbi:uncharacterized protein A4U43_C01F5940 [Asparagus officinalis]|uniref:Uncharacterized protein n=1 Tax=Asparagus officinalis TaxID=4686 RepID=A0A5P1FPP5_ASPOF|nr:protein trichome birefringence-like 21 isoform X2 [Asparagus officinalis]ONK79397.1 uncharacterized protein A4U43_C01F5940 [Asparagus officinalis]